MVSSVRTLSRIKGSNYYCHRSRKMGGAYFITENSVFLHTAGVKFSRLLMTRTPLAILSFQRLLPGLRTSIGSIRQNISNSTVQGALFASCRKTSLGRLPMTLPLFWSLPVDGASFEPTLLSNIPVHREDLTAFLPGFTDCRGGFASRLARRPIKHLIAPWLSSHISISTTANRIL